MLFAVGKGKFLEHGKDKAVPYATYCNIFARGGLDTGKMKGQELGNSMILNFCAFHRTFKK